MKQELKKDLSNLKEYLKEMVGIDIELCDHFTGIRKNNNSNYINIIFKDILPESKDYDLLENYLKTYRKDFNHIEPNGVRRASLFFTNK